ncbi:MAG: DNA polymerase I [Clostridiales bacterium]|nr:DNA polymerase I [Clostridiales bacterium]
MEKLVLIDGNSLINRAFYAMPLLTTKIGTPTNAVYGFMNMFFKMLGEIKPKYVAVAFDLKAPTFRHKMYDGYKATRKPMPEELRPQIPLLKEVLTLMGVTVLEKEGSEADDIIGTVAKHTSIQTVIFTGDKDSFQLVDNETEVHFTKRGITDVEIYNAKNFTEKTGLAPAQIIELKALMGDSSDNIPGIAGIGEKTAVSLLQSYGSVEGVYQNLEQLKGKLKEKIEQGKDSAYLSKTLATIDCDCGVETDVSKMTVPTLFSTEVKKKFIQLEFKSLYKKDEWFESDNESEQVKTETAFSHAESVIISSTQDLTTLFEKPLALIISEKSINLSDGKTEYVLPIKETLFDDGFNLSDALNTLIPAFTGKEKLIVYSKKDLKHYVLNCINVELSAPCDDVSIMKYLADFSGRDESFDDVITQYDLDKNTPAFSLFFARNLLSAKLEEEQMTDLYENVELPLSDVLFSMEQSGFRVDINALNLAGEQYRNTLNGLENEIRTLVDEPNLNVNSPKQLGDVIFEKLRLGKGKKTKHGYSTTAEVLESLEGAHPVIPLILNYRRIQKLNSTYVEGFKPLIEKSTGLIHTSFNQTVTATGRLSSKEPNLQNIPVRDDESKEIRKFFVPKSQDRILIGADYSQIELRLLACFSGCESLITAFRENQDVHAQTASKVFGVPLSSVSPTMRSSAKAVNFGIIYGMSEYGLAKTLKIENYKAREYIDSYFKQYPEVKAYMDKNVAFAKEHGYATTLLGRRRYIRELLSTNYNLRQFGERVAMNMPLQGSSADIIKLAMLGVQKRLKKENLKSELILQVHDELIIDAFIDEKEQVEKILTEEMEGAVNLAVPLTVGLGSGKTWFDAK